MKKRKAFEIDLTTGDLKNISNFNCDFPGCNRKFMRKNNLTNHLKSNVMLMKRCTELPQCIKENCGIRFCSFIHLKYHIKEEHNHNGEKNKRKHIPKQK